MKGFRSFVAISALAAAAGFVTYRFVLSDQDRASLTSMLQSAKGLYDEIAARVKPLIERNDIADDDSNREETLRQWTELGY